MNRAAMIERAKAFQENYLSHLSNPREARVQMMVDFALQEIERERAERLAEIRRKLDIKPGLYFETYGE